MCGRQDDSRDPIKLCREPMLKVGGSVRAKGTCPRPLPHLPPATESPPSRPCPRGPVVAGRPVVRPATSGPPRCAVPAMVRSAAAPPSSSASSRAETAPTPLIPPSPPPLPLAVPHPDIKHADRSAQRACDARGRPSREARSCGVRPTLSSAGARSAKGKQQN